MIYVDDVNTLGGSVHTMKKNTEALVFVSKESGVEGNADKTKYMVMFRDENGGQNHNINIGNKSFEMVEQFRYFRITLRITIPFTKKRRAD